MRCAAATLIVLVGAGLADAVRARQAEEPRLPPTSQAVPAETVDMVFRRINSIPPKKLTDHDRALRAGLDFCLALGGTDGRRAIVALDSTGYQPLPLAGELPEQPARAIAPAALQALVAGRRSVAVGGLPAADFQLLRRDALRPIFPAVAKWMLPDDYALVVRPPIEQPPADWVQRMGCVVIRVRGVRPTLMGGNLLEALERR